MSDWRDLARVGFYLGLAYHSLAARIAATHFRPLRGETVGEGSDHIGAAIGPLVDIGLIAPQKHRRSTADECRV